MDKVVNSILLLIISVQIACKGSDNLPPVFSGKTDFTVAEGQQLNVDLNFVDPEGDQVKLSLGGGADQHHFAMTASDGLIFVNFPDFEFPSDANTDNNYELTIAASDGINQTLQPIRIEVINLKLTVAVDNSLVFIDTGEFASYDHYMDNAVALDANELFTLDGLENNSIVVSVGGTDKVSGNDLGNLVLAGYGRVHDDFNITPLSTILVNLESLNDSDLQQLLVAFGVGAELSIEDIVTLDPWGSVQRGDNSADLLLRTNQQLLNLMLTLGNLGNQDTIAGAAGNNRALAAALFSYMESADGQSINLGNAQTLNSIIATVASELDYDLARDAEAIAAVSSRLALINTALQDQTINPIGEDAAMIISAAQVVLQDAVQQLSAVEGGISTEQFEEQTSVYSLFNRLSGIESIALDSDNQHTGASSSGNNRLETAQSVANPVTLSGHVNSVGEAEAGTSTTTADIQDIFRIEASGGEVVNLIMPASYPADLDLYIYDGSQNLIDYSIGDGRFESVKLPADAGVYYIDIRTHETGASTYELTIGHNEQLATTGLSATESTFVIGQMIVQQPSEETEIIVEGFVISQQWRSGSAVTSLYVNQNAANDASGANDASAILALKADTLRTIKTANRNSIVNYAEPNFIRQHIANPFTQWFEKRFNSPVTLSETSGAAQSDAVTVAVIDTGIWEEHSDLEVVILDEQYDFVSDIRNAGDGDGIDQTATDPGDGRDNINCQDSNSAISSFHGTQVAGVIG
ncbi:MAG: hypothetical protein QF884_07875, partial [Porticoccaceae bacterium]|nr:hypothetical protein [Porticoccaceae bacterium]